MNSPPEVWSTTFNETFMILDSHNNVSVYIYIYIYILYMYYIVKSGEHAAHSVRVKRQQCKHSTNRIDHAHQQK